MIEDLIKELNKISDKKYYLHKEYMPAARGGFDRNREPTYMLMIESKSYALDVGVSYTEYSNYLSKEDMVSFLARLTGAD